jgi:predicted small secreted protein
MMNAHFLIAIRPRATRAAAVLLLAIVLAGCTQEQQNKLGRDIQNWTGTNGVLEVYAGERLARRFLAVDKLSTALGTDDGRPRAYRFGYGVLDDNQNFTVDPGEKKVYFEVGDHTPYVFFENPR